MTAGTDVASALAEARRVGDAVLFEGYLLYPYRASATKNQMRFQWGVLMPPAYATATAGERSALVSEFVLDPRPRATVTVQLRFLRVRARAVERVLPQQPARYVPTPRLSTGTAELFPFDEAEPVEVDATLDLDTLLASGLDLPVRVAADRDASLVAGASGEPAGRVVRRGWDVQAVLRLGAERLPGPCGACRLSLTVENTSPCPPRPRRQGALRRALVGTHVVVTTSAGAFLSMVDPPEWAAAAVAGCRNDGVWPTLVGSEGRSPVMLASPVILDDAPRVAPESPTDLFDATEIDEILSLRTLTLTDEEKREARATDPRAAALLDHVEGLPPEILDRLHGAIRGLGPSDDPTPPTDARVAAPADPTGPTPWWDPGADAAVSPTTDRVTVGDVSVGRGDTVRLQPGARRADAHDLFLAGRLARVEAVFSDLEGGMHLAVTLADDPAADLLGAEGRYLYFRPDEVEALADEPSRTLADEPGRTP